MTYTVPWRCRHCRTTGTVVITPEPNTRENRLQTLFTATLEQHPQHGILNIFWTFTPEWATAEFINE